MENELLRRIPKVDVLLAQDALVRAQAAYGRTAVLEATRALLARYREAIGAGAVQVLPDAGAMAEEAAAMAARDAVPSLRRVINATGVVLHTNLGRAPLAPQAVQAAVDVAAGYSTLEYDLQTGERGSRHSHVDALLQALTGAPAAMVVNNNAAAVLLALTVLAQGREAVVSRGELVEIGGSFRVPEIMTLSGAQLREVGTTNRTHPADYEAAIGPQTGVLLKVHTSNYRIVGFTQAVSLDALVAIGRTRDVPVLYDMGGGCLLPPAADMQGEPSVADCVRTGADVITFSGDKLLGGPQAGIVLGSPAHIARLKRHPLARALRVDKMTLAALEATLRLYRDEGLASHDIPVQRMMRATGEALRAKAERLAALLPGAPAVVAEMGTPGGGTMPGYDLPSAAVAVTLPGISAGRLEGILRAGSPPIVARIAHDRLLLDVRTMDEADFDAVARRLRDAVKEGPGG